MIDMNIDQSECISIHVCVCQIILSSILIVLNLDDIV